MSAFFPFPTNVDRLHVRDPDGARDRMGGVRTTLDTVRWAEIAAERAQHRVAALAWRDAAVRDGWHIEQTYTMEGIDNACTLTRSGGTTESGAPLFFKVQIVSRPTRPYDTDLRGGSLGGGEISAWGPDRLSIPVPVEYPGFHYFLDALTTCKHCRRGPNCGFFDPPGPSSYPVATKAYSFAGRACEECLPSLKAVAERPGWND